MPKSKSKPLKQQAMSRDNIIKIIDILQYQYNRGGVEAAEAEEIIILLLGKEHGQELIRLWNNLINSQ